MLAPGYSQMCVVTLYNCQHVSAGCTLMLTKPILISSTWWLGDLLSLVGLILASHDMRGKKEKKPPHHWWNASQIKGQVVISVVVMEQSCGGRTRIYSEPEELSLHCIGTSVFCNQTLGNVLWIGLTYPLLFSHLLPIGQMFRKQLCR